MWRAVEYHPVWYKIILTTLKRYIYICHIKKEQRLGFLVYDLPQQLLAPYAYIEQIRKQQHMVGFKSKVHLSGLSKSSQGSLIQKSKISYFSYWGKKKNTAVEIFSRLADIKLKLCSILLTADIPLAMNVLFSVLTCISLAFANCADKMCCHYPGKWKWKERPPR